MIMIMFGAKRAGGEVVALLRDLVICWDSFGRSLQALNQCEVRVKRRYMEDISHGLLDEIYTFAESVFTMIEKSKRCLVREWLRGTGKRGPHPLVVFKCSKAGPDHPGPIHRVQN